MHITPLHPDFGVQVHDIDLSQATATSGYPDIRAAFEEYSLLLFRDQALDDPAILEFGQLWGPIENRTDGPIKVSKVSNILPDGSVSLPDALHTKNLRANMLWHTDSTFLPVPALANILSARVVPSQGGTTELVSTRAGLKRLPAEMQAQIGTSVVRHNYAHSRRKIDPALTGLEIIAKWGDQHWRGTWRNPVNGRDAVYIASHACGIAGIEDDAAQDWIADVVDSMTQPQHIYSHHWRPGDVLIWDERATLHRGQPWPYEEARELASICISATDRDGLADMRPA